MTQKTTLRLGTTSADLQRAAKLLSGGGLVAFPTETVYGLGADARQGRAVAAVFAAKGRPAFNPLIVHLARTEDATQYARLDGDAARLAQAFWPGALTLVLPLAPDHGLSELVTAGLPTVGLRVPAHPTARELLAEFDGPMAGPSANPSGRISPTTADHVMVGLEGQVDAVIDAGPCPVGVESTVVGFDNETPVLLRPGGVPVEVLEQALGKPFERWSEGTAINAPGQLQSHYAPRAPVRLNVVTPEPNELYLGFGSCDGALNLSPAGDLMEAAANLFAYLHQLDAQGRPIAVAPIPQTGLGEAINDRLRRASAPRGT